MMTTDAGEVISDAILYPCGGRLVGTMVTPTDTEPSVSRSAVMLVGGSMSATFGSLFLMESGTWCTPGVVTDCQSTLTVSDDLLKPSRLDFGPPIRTARSCTDCTRMKRAGIAEDNCGTGTSMVFVSGGFPA